jgi:hypothetical protein
VALASDFDRNVETKLRDGIEALEYFAKQDAQALHDSLIIKSLLKTCTNHIQQKDLGDRLARVKASSELFGLRVGSHQHVAQSFDSVHTQGQAGTPVLHGSAGNALHNVDGFATPYWSDFDLGALGDLPAEPHYDIFGSLNLFPMFDNV